MLQGLTVSPNGEYLVVQKCEAAVLAAAGVVRVSGGRRSVVARRRKSSQDRRRADGRHRADQRRHRRARGRYRWIPLEPATLMWAEALDKGDLKQQGAASRPHPHAQGAVRRGTVGSRQDGIPLRWRELHRQGTILLTENDRASRTTRTWVLNPSWGQAAQALGPQAAGQLLASRHRRCSGPVRATIHQVGDSIYLNGAGASKEGDRPFLDRLNLATFQAERLFRSDDKCTNRSSGCSPRTRSGS